MAKNVNIFSGDSSKYLADKIAEAYGQPLGKVTIQHFQDGEYQPCFEETIRGNDVFIIQSTNAPADNLLQLLLLIDAAKTCIGAKGSSHDSLFWFCTSRS